MLELTSEQVAGLAEIDARGYVERIRQDLVKADPKLADDNTLSARLWNAYIAARQLGIHADENVEAFLRIEAYAPSFYKKPATHAWLTRPGRSPDERFHDYLRVIKWRVEHPEYNGDLSMAAALPLLEGVLAELGPVLARAGAALLGGIGLAGTASLSSDTTKDESKAKTDAKAVPRTGEKCKNARPKRLVSRKTKSTTCHRVPASIKGG